MALKNYYIVLGVKSTATIDEIKAAFRELAKKYHPDKNPGNKAAEEYFKEIQEAYMVLSNPEKKRNYDLKMMYGSSAQSKAQNTPHGRYTGNAYQYAQQQARTKNNFQFNNIKSSPKHKPEERYQVMVSVGIALLLLYFIISYSTSSSKKQERNTHTLQNQEFVNEKIKELMNSEVKSQTAQNTPQINNFDSPYTKYFGEEVYIDGNKNSIKISNSSYCEAVVCLVENKAPFKTIRNQYINAGATFKMNEVPNGNYYLKIFYGNNWDTTITFLNKKYKGGFKEQIGFVKILNGEEYFKMNHNTKGTSSSFSSYEVSLNPNSDNEKRSKISMEEFFN
jgi:hypothetical protein